MNLSLTQLRKRIEALQIKSGSGVTIKILGGLPDGFDLEQETRQREANKQNVPYPTSTTPNVVSLRRAGAENE